jgi:hypothetical protein
MSTFKSNNSRALLLASMLAVFAVSAEASPAMNDVDATQSHVRAVLEGTRSDTNFTSVSGGPSRGADIQEGVRQVLLGSTGSRADGHRSSVASSAVSTAGNRQGSDETQKVVQRLVLGHVGS